jgi:hypothetical protein
MTLQYSLYPFKPTILFKVPFSATVVAFHSLFTSWFGPLMPLTPTRAMLR